MPKITSAGSLSSRIVVKLADETVNNSNVLQDDDELFFNLGANEVWSFEIVLRLIQANAAADWNIGFSTPVGAAGRFGTLAQVNGGGSDNGIAGTLNVANGVTAETLAVLKGYVINGATPGEFRLKWSQSTATVADNKVLADSFLLAQRLR